MQSTDAEQFRELVASVHAFYRRDTSDFSLSVWWTALKSYDLAAVRDAFGRYCVQPEDAAHFMPMPGDIAKLIGGGTQDRALVSWARVQQAMQAVGVYTSVVFDDPIIHAVLNDMGGWIALGGVELKELPFRGKEFENRYRGYLGRAGTPAHPSVLLGITDRDNASHSFRLSEPVLIGDPQRALIVAQGGTVATLQITRASDLVKRLTDGGRREGAQGEKATLLRGVTAHGPADTAEQPPHSLDCSDPMLERGHV